MLRGDLTRSFTLNLTLRRIGPRRIQLLYPIAPAFVRAGINLGLLLPYLAVVKPAAPRINLRVDHLRLLLPLHLGHLLHLLLDRNLPSPSVVIQPLPIAAIALLRATVHVPILLRTVI